MKHACLQAETAGSEWREALFVAFDLSLPGFFNIEWLIEEAEHGEWRGLWW
ncbi:hypothetical protein [uncultured Roseobacter sp.]|uniref:hypothetical protein n=1 Tax=uncultured Roseobacter sp. TaxID=114847 RepID=UPI002625E436|nr:hypothetical protein [uncultured Roseobacter sp.]